MRRLWRSAAVVVLVGGLAVWGATALAAGAAGGFVGEPVSVTADSGAMYSLPALAPGQTITRYATVRSTGSPASVRLYATVTGTGLPRFLTVTVTRATDSERAAAQGLSAGADFRWEARQA